MQTLSEHQLQQGGFSRKSLADFKAALATYEGGELRKRVPKTEGASKALQFSEMMWVAQTTTNEIERRGVPGTAQLWDNYVRTGALGAFGNYFLEEKGQRYRNAADLFILATLYRLSGAAITDAEREFGYTTYIPLPGDTDGMIRQKKANRDAVMHTTRMAAGLAWDDTAEERKLFKPPPVPWENKAKLDNAIKSGIYKDGETVSYMDSNNAIQVFRVNIK